MYLLRELRSQRVGRVADVALEAPPQHVPSAAGSRAQLILERGGLCTPRPRLLREPLLISQHLHAPLLPARQDVHRPRKGVVLTLEHLAHAILALVDRAQTQRHDGGLGEHALEHRLVRPRHALEPIEVVQVVP